MYDFETLAPARNSCPDVWEKLRAKGITEPDAICYGVAEMKFPIAPEIKSALHACIEDGYFGYTRNPRMSRLACDWMSRRHGWQADASWVMQTYGVVSAIAVAIRSLSDPGDGVIIQTPVYNPFFEEILSNGRTVLDNRLLRTENGYVIDFDDLEKKASDPRAKLLVLCSPHNPVGRVWTRGELNRIADICVANNVIVISDEIHNDLIYGTSKHTIFALISPEAEQNCVVCTAPSKTFNIPGLVTSNIFVPNADIHEKFRTELKRSTGDFLNTVGMAAAEAAYTQGEAWLGELRDYLAENAEYFHSLVSEKLPLAWTPKMDGTYLAWLDLSFLGLTDDELEHFLLEKAGVWVNMGSTYGKAGSGFVRINIACPRRYIEKLGQSHTLCKPPMRCRIEAPHRR